MSLFSKTALWKISCFLFLLLAVFTFTPWVIPVGEFEPFVFGMPRTLWAGILVAVGFVVLAGIGSYCQPLDEDDN